MTRAGGSARGTGTAGAGAPATAFTTAKLQARGDRKSHIGHVDFHGRGFFQQFFFYDNGVSGDVEHLVRFARLIQSQRQPGASSAAGRQVDPDRGFFLFRKVPVKLGFCGFRQFNHGNLLEQARSMQLSTTDQKVK